MKSYFSSVVFLSFITLATAATSIVDDSYTSYQDLYDAVLTTLFPVTFVLLLNVSEKPGSIKNTLLPLLDDVLYNTVTWVIPLAVSFAYDDLGAVKIFSIVNMCLHITCALLALIKWKRIAVVGFCTGAADTKGFFCIFVFLVFFPVAIIPVFWIAYLVTNHMIGLINLYLLFCLVFCWV